MYASSISKRFAPVAMALAIATSFLATACSAMEANANGGYAVAGNSSSKASCDSARLAAWFQRQRELTDGDVNPAIGVKAPECARTTASNDDKSSRTVQAKSE